MSEDSYVVDLDWALTEDEPENGEFFVGCNDVFWWGTADAEPVTSANLPILLKAIADTAKVGHASWGTLLFCCRVRNMRMQGAYYRGLPEPLRPLFDAAGPEREINIGNPCDTQGEYRYSEELSDS